MRPVGKLRKLIGLRWGLPYVRRADRHRDRGEWIDAVVLYHRGLDWMPWREDLRIQIGNCLKEYGDYEGAVRAYRTVVGSPSRMEAQIQLRDVDRRAGNIILPYEIAEAAPNGGAPDFELPETVSAEALPGRLRVGRKGRREWLGTLGRVDNVNVRIRGNSFAAIKLDQVGAMALERDGLREPMLAGVFAIRGRLLAFGRITSVDVVQETEAGAKVVATVPVSQVEVAPGPLKMFVFNAWLDSAGLVPGRSWLSVRVEGKEKIAPAGLFVNVVAIDETAPELRVSSSFVPSPAAGTAVDEGVIAAPAEIRPAFRSIFERPIASILVVRADQLGDLSATLPAMRRLRELYPEARITTLVQPATEAVVAASGVADEVVTLTLDYNAKTERRHLSVEEERRLRGRLGRYDLAIDLCPGSETRPLLLLCEATYLVGFEPDRFPFLDFGIAVRSHDKVNRLEKLAHSAHVSSLVEALAVAVAPTRGIVPRESGGTAALTAQGLVPGGYVVLHTGARHPLNQWPLERFAALAVRILETSDAAVALFGEPGDWIQPALGRYGDRVRMLPMLAPDDFDQIISSARAMVGNDSGPKHLASVRGVPTVSIHVGRLNWNEWGQDGRGAIVAKRVPCAGCGLNDIALCGREAVCVRSITVEEVFGAVRPYLDPGA